MLHNRRTANDCTRQTKKDDQKTGAKHDTDTGLLFGAALCVASVALTLPFCFCTVRLGAQRAAAAAAAAVTRSAVALLRVAVRHDASLRVRVQRAQ